MDDIQAVKNLVSPLAKRLGGIFAGRIINAINEENIRLIYREVGEEGIRQAAEAIIRIGKGDLNG